MAFTKRSIWFFILAVFNISICQIIMAEESEPILNLLGPDDVNFIANPDSIDVTFKTTTKKVPENKYNLVVVTHGWFEQKPWPQELIKTLRSKVNSKDWVFGWYDWHKQAFKIMPVAAAEYGRDSAGPMLGEKIVKLNKNWNHVHLIGHSAGSWVINEAAKVIAKQTNATIHLTFLDAYVPLNWQESDLANFKNEPNLVFWADNYFTRDISLETTEVELTNAHNIDLTDINPGFKDHQFPHYWYRATMLGKFADDQPYKGKKLFYTADNLKYGFYRSMEGGKKNWQISMHLPAGNQTVKILEPEPSFALQFKNSIKRKKEDIMSNMSNPKRQYNGLYKDDYLNQVAFPMGGIGAGMICLEGSGCLSHVSIRNKPEIFYEPCTFAAICIKGEKNLAKVLEGPVPKWKIFGPPRTANGAPFTSYGLPRFSEATFGDRFPFGTVTLQDSKIPLVVEITGWSPFIPNDANNSSLPAAALEYKFTNTSDKKIEAIYSFNSFNLLQGDEKKQKITKMENGFIMHKLADWDKGAVAVFTDDPKTKVNCGWFRGAWFDPMTMVWKDVEEGAYFDKEPFTKGDASRGGSLFVPVELNPGESKTITLQICWYVPGSPMRIGKDPKDCENTCLDPNQCKPGNSTYQPWYSGKFASVEEVAKYWQENYSKLRIETQKFTDCFYDTTLPDEVVEAIAANLTILKSPTVLRQQDGRLWCFEGCSDNDGCCHGSCTHVWNYAQAIPHLFPSLERTLRETEFFVSQGKNGHQTFRSALPIRCVDQESRAASDGQLGGIMKVYREWRISGNTDWLKQIWPRVKDSLNYCIETWDPKHNGVLSEPHHNTYDIEFWGPDGMCSSFYLGALEAAIKMGKAVNDEVPLYSELFEKGQKYLQEKLFNGEYFYQDVQTEGLNTKFDMKGYSPEAKELAIKEGPKYQYGKGCLSDGVLGSWIARVCGLDDVLDKGKIASHLKSVHTYNFKKDLSEHANPQRPSYAMGNEGGLLLCTWPKGDMPSLPFVYSNEVWTGIEYQAASHLMMYGMVNEGLEIVKACRDRYDGRVRNPFDEYECGHWYARAMSSYGLLQGLTSIRYDAVEKVLYIQPNIKGDFRSFLCTASGYGTVGVEKGKPFVKVREGKIEIDRIEYTAAK